ncbi:MAG: hypothetical protein QOE20_3151 [Mycobacterium sp.]|jgi:hypothetical protein|nr:hypothetical protein [Mycobacterium sp.]
MTNLKITRHEVPDPMACDLGPRKFRMDELVRSSAATSRAR